MQYFVAHGTQSMHDVRLCHLPCNGQPAKVKCRLQSESRKISLIEVRAHFGDGQIGMGEGMGWTYRTSRVEKGGGGGGFNRCEI